MTVSVPVEGEAAQEVQISRDRRDPFGRPRRGADGSRFARLIERPPADGGRAFGARGSDRSIRRALRFERRPSKSDRPACHGRHFAMPAVCVAFACRADKVSGGARPSSSAPSRLASAQAASCDRASSRAAAAVRSSAWHREALNLGQALASARRPAGRRSRRLREPFPSAACGTTRRWCARSRPPRRSIRPLACSCGRSSAGRTGKSAQMAQAGEAAAEVVHGDRERRAREGPASPAGRAARLRAAAIPSLRDRAVPARGRLRARLPRHAATRVGSLNCSGREVDRDADRFRPGRGGPAGLFQDDAAEPDDQTGRFRRAG